MSRAIGVHDLSISVRGKPHPRTLLSGVNFEVERGKFIAVIGASGCGKSPLINSLARLILAVALCISAAGANPVNLEAPSNSIGAADPYGNLRVWREIGEVDFGKNLTLPLWIEFSSANPGDSPYAGRGWWIPLIEARAFLKRETMLQATLLCGKSLFLRRDKNDMAKFQTLDRDWTALINEHENAAIAGIKSGNQAKKNNPALQELKYMP